MTIITKAGIYDLPMEVYHSQCCDGPSLSSSEARILTLKTPAHLQASRLEPYERSRKADLGTAIHALVLEPFHAESNIVVIKADSFRTGDAKDQAARAMNANKTPLLVKDYEIAKRAADKLLLHPVMKSLLKEGDAEKSWFAKDRQTGIWVKARPDFVSASGVMVDIKTVGDCTEEFIQRRMYEGGWFQQAPWHAHVYERVKGQPIADYLWVCIEQELPNAIRIVRPVEPALIHGARLNDRALRLYAECARANVWPDYERNVQTMGLLDWAYSKLEFDAEREDRDGDTAMKAVRLAAQTNAHVFS